MPFHALSLSFLAYPEKVRSSKDDGETACILTVLASAPGVSFPFVQNRYDIMMQAKRS